MNEKKLYTLKEAQLTLNQKECKRVGHNYSVRETPNGEAFKPVMVSCLRCGRSWEVGKESEE